MRNSAIERDLERLHIRFLETAYVMQEKGVINEAQRDKLIDLLERIDECKKDEFVSAWREVIEMGRATA